MIKVVVWKVRRKNEKNQLENWESTKYIKFWVARNETKETKIGINQKSIL